MPNIRKVHINHRTLVRVESERAYDALTSSKGLDAWFTTGAEVDARPRGHITFRWKDWGPNRVTAEDGGPVLTAVRPERFVFQWHPDSPDDPTTVDLRFTAVVEGTLVQVSEYGYQDTESGFKAVLWCAAGWGEALALLKVYLEHGVSVLRGRQ